MLTSDSASGDFSVVGFGSEITDVENVVLGSNQSVTIPSDSGIIVKAMCEEAYILSASITVSGATKVTFSYMDPSGTEVLVFEVYMSNPDIKPIYISAKSFTSECEIFNRHMILCLQETNLVAGENVITHSPDVQASQVFIQFEGSSVIIVQDLTLHVCCLPVTRKYNCLI